MNAIHKYVVSATLPSAAAWHNSTQIQGDIVNAVRSLKQQPGKNILIDGNNQLVPLLAAHDLVDEYCLHVYPLSLGGGKRIFPAGKWINLSLVAAEPLPTGVVYLRYRRSS